MIEREPIMCGEGTTCLAPEDKRLVGQDRAARDARTRPQVTGLGIKDC